MGDKQILGAQLGRVTGKIMGVGTGKENFSMVRSVNVFNSVASRHAKRGTKRAKRADSSASSSKKSAKSPEEIADARSRNLKKANRALKKARSEK